MLEKPAVIDGICQEGFALCNDREMPGGKEVLTFCHFDLAIQIDVVMGAEEIGVVWRFQINQVGFGHMFRHPGYVVPEALAELPLRGKLHRHQKGDDGDVLIELYLVEDLDVEDRSRDLSLPALTVSPLGRISNFPDWLAVAKSFTQTLLASYSLYIPGKFTTSFSEEVPV